MISKILLLVGFVFLIQAACPGPNRSNGSQCKRNGQCASGWCRNRYRTKCKNGVCEAKRSNGVDAYRSRKASCASNKQRCGICGNSGRSTGEKCSADVHCSSGFCKGKGSCAGRCKAKKSSGSDCWENSVGSCITRGCHSGKSVCGVCHNNNLSSNEKCTADNQCSSGFCKGKGSCNGRCKNKQSDGNNCFKNAANTCITRGCVSGTAACGKCGNSNLSSYASCYADNQCASGFCKGKGSCAGYCVTKVEDIYPCHKNSVDACIDRGCVSGAAMCGRCGDSNTERNDGALCNANKNCKSGYCSNKDGITCAGVCKQCPPECGIAGCHERNGEEVCGDKNIATWFEYLAEDFKDSLGSLGECFAADYEYADCVLPIVESAVNCVKDTSSCSISLCPSGNVEDCKCFAFEKTFENEDSSTFTQAQSQFLPSGAEIVVTTTNEMVVTGVVTGGLVLTPNAKLEVQVMQSGQLPLIDVASTLSLTAIADYEFTAENWDNRRVPLANPHKVIQKLFMAGVVPVIVQVLVTPVAFVTIEGKFFAGNSITINVNGELKLENPLTAAIAFGSNSDASVAFEKSGFEKSNFIADFGAVAEYSMTVEAELNLRINIGAEFTLFVEGVSTTIAPTFETNFYVKGHVTEEGEKCMHCEGRGNYYCNAIIEAGIEFGLGDPQALVSFDPASTLEKQAENSGSTDSCVDLMYVAEEACKTLSVEGGCGVMTTICEKSVNVLDVVTPSLKICIPNVELFSVDFPSLSTPNFAGWDNSRQYCIKGNVDIPFQGEIIINKHGEVETNFSSEE